MFCVDVIPKARLVPRPEYSGQRVNNVSANSLALASQIISSNVTGSERLSWSCQGNILWDYDILVWMTDRNKYLWFLRMCRRGHG